MLSTFGGSLLVLESRIMFDGAAVATASAVTTEHIAQSQAEASFGVDNTTSADSVPAAPTGEPQPISGDQALFDALAAYDSAARQEIVFLSPSVLDYQKLLDGISPNVEVHILDATHDGVAQMAEILAGRTGIDAIHIISHGAQAELTLGTARLTLDSMNGVYASELAVIGQSLSEKADLLIYGCRFGQGEGGAEAAMLLGQLTGADVAASTDDTGHASLGGDWDLEHTVGPVETSQLFTTNVQQDWSHLMATETILDNFDGVAAYNNNNGTQSWSTNWIETDNLGGGAGGGNIRVIGGALGKLFIDMGLGTVGNNIYRQVDLTSALSATLSYSYTSSLGVGGSIQVRISNDGGSSYTTLQTYSTLPATGIENFDITAYRSVNTRLLFIVTGGLLLNNIEFDNVQISYVTNDPPVGVPTITGTVIEDQTLTAVTTGISDPNGLGPFSYQWLRNGVAVAGATASTYLLGDADVGAQMSVQVTYIDGQGTVEGPLTSAQTTPVANVNDAPVITSDGGGDTAVVNADENQDSATTVTSTDVDGGAPTYTIVGGADAGLFTLDATTGALTFNVAPDFEAPDDADADNIYDVTVQVTDGNGGIDTQVLSIMVNDVLEGLPPIPPNNELPPPLPPIVGGPPISPPPGPRSPFVPVGPDNGPGDIAPTPPLAVGVPVAKGGNSSGPSVPLVREPLGYPEEKVAPLIDQTSEEVKKVFDKQTLMEAPARITKVFEKTLSVVEEDLQRATDMSESQRQFVIRVTNIGGITLTAGIITWLLQSGALLASLTATMPAWRHFDPLPVVLVGDRERRKRKAERAAAAEHENKQFRGLKHLLDRKVKRSGGGGRAA